MENTFKVTIDGSEKEFEIKSISLNDQREAQKIYNQAFSDAVKSGSIVRARLDDLLKQQGLWDDGKQMQFLTLQRQINDKEKILAKGGISLNQAKNVAISIRKLRTDLRDLISVKTELDSHTAEGQADNARFNYFVSVCVVYKDTQEKLFKNYEDYLNRSSELVSIIAAQKAAYIIYGLDSDFEKNLPENKFLVKYKLANNNLEFIDKSGKTVDEDGRLIDKNGRYINEQGQFVDVDGNLVDSVGEPIAEFVPFLDEDGKPIVLDETNNENETEPEQAPVAKSKQGRPKKTEVNQSTE